MKTSKTWLWILLIVVVLALVWVAWRYFVYMPVLETNTTVLDNDTTAAIGNDLNAVDMGNPDNDLKQLDADLNQL